MNNAGKLSQQHPQGKKVCLNSFQKIKTKETTAVANTNKAHSNDSLSMYRIIKTVPLYNTYSRFINKLSAHSLCNAKK